MTITITIPTTNGNVEAMARQGESILIVGANGSGKTRLAAYIEESLGNDAHRISAHRALTLSTTVPKISEDKATRRLRYGAQGKSVDARRRKANRWGSNSATKLLSDFDALIQVLFAEQTNIAVKSHRLAHREVTNGIETTKFQKLEDIWGRLLPHRKLIVTGDDIQVAPTSPTEVLNNSYSASDMSDGERAIFYLVGQALTAPKESLFIVDEPELHVHKSIMSKLWDELEAARIDCVFLYITHDLEFAASKACDKFVVHNYIHPNSWEVQRLQEDSGFSEELYALILGSRKPILFVEGDDNSLDKAIYRCCYPDWTVIPRNSCDEVIVSVVAMRNNESLTRLTCAGLVDADGRSAEDEVKLRRLGISILPVSEIENIFLLPIVSRAIAKMEKHNEPDTDQMIELLFDRIDESLETAGKIEKAVIRHCKRQIDRTLKRLELGSVETTTTLSQAYRHETSQLNIEELASTYREKIQLARTARNMEQLLKLYDNKELFAMAGSILKGTRKKSFEAWITRALASAEDNELKVSLKEILPTVG